MHKVRIGCSTAGDRTHFGIIFGRLRPLTAGDDVNTGPVVGADILVGGCTDIFGGHLGKIFEIVFEILPANLNFEGRQGPGQAIIAAHPVYEIALIELFDSLQLAWVDKLCFHFVDLVQQQSLQLYACLKIRLPLFFIADPLLLHKLRFVGRSAQDYHAGIAIVGIVAPG